MSTLLKRNLKALTHFVSRDAARPLLTAVHLTDTVAEATDSYRAARIHFVADGTPIADFPSVGGKRPVEDPVDVCIEGRALFRALDAPRNRRATLPILSHAAIVDVSETNVSIATTDLETSTITVTRTMTDVGAKGLFPSIGKLMDEAKAGTVVEIAFDARFLKQLAAAFVTFGAKRVVVKIEHPIKPALFAAENNEGELMEAVLMPVRDGGVSS